MRSVELRSPVGHAEAHVLDDVPDTLARAERWQNEGLHVVAFVAYDAAPAFDPAFAVPSGSRAGRGGRGGRAGRESRWADLPLAWCAAFAQASTSTSAPVPAWPRVAAGQPDGPPQPGQLGQPDEPVTPALEGWCSDLSRADHAAAVAAVQAAIARGDTYLVNLTTRLRRPLRGHRATPGVGGAHAVEVLYRQLAAGHRGGPHVLVDAGPWAVACGSPELFFELDGDRITTRPIKGTASRGRWPAEDDAAAAGLAGSEKEIAEITMIVDLLRNDVGRIAVPGSVAVPGGWTVERHPALLQLTAAITARLRPGTGLVDVFGALFPCGSVTGAPKVATMAAIADLERSPRGLYCGAVGLMEPGGRTTFSVAIRTAVVDRVVGVVEYGTGGGITWDSDPVAEWAEVGLKATVLTAEDAMGPPAGPIRVPSMATCDLIETMGLEPVAGSCGVDAPAHGRGPAPVSAPIIRDLDRHLDRLRASARTLGRPVPDDVRQRTVDAAAAALASSGEGPRTHHRVRLMLAADGTVDVCCDPFAAPRAVGPPPGIGTAEDDVDRLLPVVCLDPQPVRSDDPSLFHKTSARSRYDTRADRHPDAHDVLLVNERSEVTETTRANVAVRQGGRWVTPPLTSGLLPGVARGRLLEEGVLVEGVVTVDDLRTAGAVATFSSLRGWQAVRLAARCPHQPGSSGAPRPGVEPAEG